jgi:hypothetical protein
MTKYIATIKDIAYQANVYVTTIYIIGHQTDAPLTTKGVSWKMECVVIQMLLTTIAVGWENAIQLDLFVNVLITFIVQLQIVVLIGMFKYLMMD